MKHVLLSLLFLFLLTPAFSQWNGRPGPGDGEIKVYPNPAVDYISIEGKDSIKNLHIYDLLGKRLKTYRVVENAVFYVGDLPRGTYLVQFVNPDNRTLATRRLNKQ